jgi:hypothetical protein
MHDDYAREAKERNTTLAGLRECANLVPNRIESVLKDWTD